MVNKRTVGFLTGCALFSLILVLPPADSVVAVAGSLAAQSNGSLATGECVRSMQSVLAVMALMVSWWISEAVPMAATALIPLVAFPLLRVTGLHQGVPVRMDLQHIAVSYAHPVIFLFLGGFLIAGAMQKWKVDRRITLWLLSRGKLADDSKKILLAIMGVTAFLSMWISNTATVALMLPLALGIISLAGAKPGESRFGTALMLGVACSASIGGMATIIGSPPNGIALGILSRTLGEDPSYRQISFLDWMTVGVPYAFLFIPIAWLLLVRLFPPEVSRIAGGRAKILTEYRELGSLQRGEKQTLGILGIALFLWVFLPLKSQLLPGFTIGFLEWIDEYTVGILAGVLLFVVPMDLRRPRFTLDWSVAGFVEWGILILFGGGIALSDGMFKTGVALWIATTFVNIFGTPSMVVLILVTILLIDLLTEITSNTAVASMMVPIVISIARESGGSPTALAIAAGMAASLAFMLPVATPPNALVFSTGYVSLRDMIKAGALLDVIGWLLTFLVVLGLAGYLLGLFPL